MGSLIPSSLHKQSFLEFFGGIEGDHTVAEPGYFERTIKKA
jgi:hypothetical protein